MLQAAGECGDRLTVLQTILVLITMSEFHVTAGCLFFALFCVKSQRLRLFAEDSLMKVAVEVSRGLVLRNAITDSG